MFNADKLTNNLCLFLSQIRQEEELRRLTIRHSLTLLSAHVLLFYMSTRRLWQEVEKCAVATTTGEKDGEAG